MVLLLIPTLILAAGLVLDGASAVAAHVRLVHVADEAARSGAMELDLATYRRSGHVVLDPAAAARQARRTLAAAGVSGHVTVTGNEVRVAATGSVPTRLLGLAGVSQLIVHGSGTARPVRGDGQSSG